MPRLRANGISFHYQRLGAGERTVVFLHGLVMDNLSSWWYTVANAAARGSDVLLYDMRGHGMSERPPTGYGVSASVADLFAVMDCLGIDWPVHLVGNSYGGVVALAAASARPDRIASLALVEAHAALEGQSRRTVAKMVHGLDLAGVFLDDSDVNDWLDRLGGRKLNRLAEVARALIDGTSLVEDLRSSPPFSREELAAITCPALLVYGEESDIFDRAILLSEILPASELHVVKGVDHSVLTQATPELRALLVDWLERPLPALPGTDGAIPCGADR